MARTADPKWPRGCSFTVTSIDLLIVSCSNPSATEPAKTGILEQKVGSEPHVEHMGGGDLLDEKENSHEYKSSAKNQQCLDFISNYSKGDSKANVGQQWGETTGMSSPVLNCSWNGLRPRRRQCHLLGSTRDFHETVQWLGSALHCYWPRSAVAAFGLQSYLADGFPQLLYKTMEEQWQSAAAFAPWWAQWITGWKTAAKPSQANPQPTLFWEFAAFLDIITSEVSPLQFLLLK